MIFCQGQSLQSEGRFCGIGAVPHVMEPAYPGALGHYINLGTYYNRRELRPFGEELVELSKKYKACYARAYQCLKAAREVRQNGEQGFLTPVAQGKIKKRAVGILSRELKRKKGERGGLSQRFMSAITCQGLMSLHETLSNQYKRIYELQESCGLAHCLLDELKEGVLEAGYDVIACPSPEDPDRLEHLLVPELSLAFVTTQPHKALEKRPYRRIRMESMVEKDLLKANRSKLRFSNRIAGGLLEDGIKELEQAKQLHDALEAIYNPFVDFAGVNKMTKSLLEEIQAL